MSFLSFLIFFWFKITVLSLILRTLFFYFLIFYRTFGLKNDQNVKKNKKIYFIFENLHENDNRKFWFFCVKIGGFSNVCGSLKMEKIVGIFCLYLQLMNANLIFRWRRGGAYLVHRPILTNLTYLITNLATKK